MFKNLSSLAIRMTGLPGLFIAQLLNRIHKEKGYVLRVLDIGSGSGRPWAVASNFLQTKMISLTALDGAEIPEREHGFNYCQSAIPISRLHGDLLTELASFKDNEFDIAVALDVIEHLSKEDGYRLLYEMNRVSTTAFAVGCPVGFFWQPPQRHNSLQAHISGWLPREFKQMGFQKVKTWHGFRIFTLPYNQKRYKLNLLTGFLYVLEVRLAKFLPGQAACLWAVRFGKLPDQNTQIDTYTKRFILPESNF